MSKEEIEEWATGDMEQKTIAEDPNDQKRKEAKQAEDDKFMSADERFTSEEDGEMDLNSMKKRLRNDIMKEGKEGEKLIREEKLAQKERKTRGLWFYFGCRFL